MNLNKHTWTLLLILTLSWLPLGCSQTEQPDQTAETQGAKPTVERSSEVTLSALVEAVEGGVVRKVLVNKYDIASAVLGFYIKKVLKYRIHLQPIISS